MKSQLTKVSLAVLSMVFLLGCQERGSEPVGPDGLGPQFAKPGRCITEPEHPSCEDTPGDGTSVPATLVLRSGLVNTTGQPLNFNDATKILGFGPDLINFEIDLQETQAGMCRNGGKGDPGETGVADLIAKLDRDLLLLGRLNLTIDKETVDDPETSELETSELHQIGSRWDEEDGSETFSMSVGKLAPCKGRACGPGSPSRVTVDRGGTSVTVTFHAGFGEIRLRDHTGKFAFSITCPLLDDIVFELTPVTS